MYWLPKRFQDAESLGDFEVKDIAELREGLVWRDSDGNDAALRLDIVFGRQVPRMARPRPATAHRRVEDEPPSSIKARGALASAFFRRRGHAWAARLATAAEG